MEGFDIRIDVLSSIIIVIILMLTMEALQVQDEFYSEVGCTARD